MSMLTNEQRVIPMESEADRARRYTWEPDDEVELTERGGGESFSLDDILNGNVPEAEESEEAGETARANDSDGPVSNAHHWHGLTLVIETPKGEVRRGKGWATVMPYDYGYIDGQMGADGDSLDVAVGPSASSEWVYLIDQNQLPPAQGFDETKVFVGYGSAHDALTAFRRGHHRAGEVMRDWTPMHVDQFKQWLHERDVKKPAGVQS